MSPCRLRRDVPLSPGGDERNRTADPLLAKQVLSQLSYTPSGSLSSLSALKIKQRFFPLRFPDLEVRALALFSIERR